MKRVFAVATGLALSLAPVLINAGSAAADPRGWPTGNNHPLDYVVQRALSQRGVPYVYGGGNVSGPTNGVRPDSKTAPRAKTPQGQTPQGTTAQGSGTTGLPGTAAGPNSPTAPQTTPGFSPWPGANTAPAPTTVGFDSSGLIQYAFAAAGIKMPRTSGEQCSVGRKVAPSQARRGDLLCYGPNGSQSVAMYLGNGQMIEATEPAVTVSAARTSNMTPYLTRIIDS